MHYAFLAWYSGKAQGQLYLYVMILPCITVTRHNNVISFLCAYFLEQSRNTPRKHVQLRFTHLSCCIVGAAIRNSDDCNNWRHWVPFDPLALLAEIERNQEWICNICMKIWKYKKDFQEILLCPVFVLFKQLLHGQLVWNIVAGLSRPMIIRKLQRLCRGVSHMLTVPRFDSHQPESQWMKRFFKFL
jgi:hypothetical protein